MDIQIDYTFRMEDVFGKTFGPELEMILTAEYFGDEFELTQIEIESDGVVMTHRDLERGMSTEQRVIWDRAQDDLYNDDAIRSKAWTKHAESKR